MPGGRRRPGRDGTRPSGAPRYPPPVTRHARNAAPGRAIVVVVSLVVLLVVAAVGAGAAVLLRGGSPAADAGPDDADGPPAVVETPTPSPTPTPEPAVFTLVATGDVLPHEPVNASAGGDFSALLSGLDPWVQGADLALCHMEVPVAPAGTRASGYPMFGAEPQLVTDLREQGWDGCSTASNHSVDRAYPGVVTTLDAFDAVGLGHAGTARSAEEQAQPQLYTLQRADRTLTVAHLSMTYGLNGLPMPAEAPWAVDLLDADRVIGQAAAAREAGADLVVVSMHAGVEYTSQPTPEQVDAATRIAASGQVDLVIGHHAHVPQPMELLPGGPDGTGMWVAYGLGNYVSNQDSACCDPRTDSGLLLTATVTQQPDGPARVTGVEWTAVTVDRKAGHRVRVLAEAVADPSGGTLSAAQLQERYDRVRAAVGTQAPERTTPPVPTGEPPTVVPRTLPAPPAG